jgi:hypothetical protein
MAKTGSYHLEIQTHRKNPYGLLRRSYREDGKVKKETLCRFSGISLEHLRLIKASIQGKTVMKEDFKITKSREYGASFACLEVLKETGLHKMIHSRFYDEWVKSSLAMIIGRIVYGGSKLSLSNCGAYSALWEVCGAAGSAGTAGSAEGKINVNSNCYEAMDKLFARQEAIQKSLAEKHLHEGIMVLYDSLMKIILLK